MASGSTSSAQDIVKKEPGTDMDLGKRIIELCVEHPEGINDELLKMALPLSTPIERVKALNELLKTGQIMVFKKKTHGGAHQLLYRLKNDSTSSSAVKGADSQEKLVYRIVSEAKNKGIWIRDIRLKTNLSVPQLNKLVKNMESKKLIKAVKAVNASKKKLYMLYDTEPDSSVTGGAWYTDDKFDQAFADVLNEQCCRYLERKDASAKERFDEPSAISSASLASAEEVHEHITKLGISTIKLTVKDITAVLNTLIYDGKAEETVRVEASGSSDDGQRMYRLLKPIIRTTGLMYTPCGQCRVRSDCTDNGPISPRTCVYMKDWLKKLEW